jgi:hypothetical protein
LFFFFDQTDFTTQSIKGNLEDKVQIQNISIKEKEREFRRSNLELAIVSDTELETLRSENERLRDTIHDLEGTVQATREENIILERKYHSSI